MISFPELLIKALAAGSQGANVVSKVVLVFLRTLIGEEEREVGKLILRIKTVRCGKNYVIASSIGYVYGFYSVLGVQPQVSWGV